MEIEKQRNLSILENIFVDLFLASFSESDTARLLSLNFHSSSAIQFPFAQIFHIENSYVLEKASNE
ncbi:MAG TPA: hypothetical protein DDW18_01165 [Firmicutes bacterium]|nr:hypothetical protein [Bacillota bacterium]HBM99948.1 hypothetical protein [Bacillota bacterium]